jgi:hypothetical protein
MEKVGDRDGKRGAFFDSPQRAVVRTEEDEEEEGRSRERRG